MKRLEQLVRSQRLGDILERFAELQDIVITVLDDEGTIANRVNWSGRCRLILDRPVGGSGRLLIPVQCIESRCPRFEHQQFSTVTAITDNVGMVIGCGADGASETRSTIELIGRVISEIVSDELEITLLADEYLGKYQELTNLHTFSRDLLVARSELDVCRISVAAAMRGLEAPWGILLLKTADGFEATAAGASETVAIGKRFASPLDDEIQISLKNCLCTKTPRLIRLNELDPVLRDIFDRSILVVPLTTRQDGECAEVSLGLLVVAASEKSISSDSLHTLRMFASQAALALDNRRIVRDRQRHELLVRNMELARQLQESFFPVAIPAGAEFDVFGRCMPADSIGGDYFDFARREDGKIVVVAADVSGHDLSSAILMAATRTVLRTHAILECTDPAHVLDMTNRTLFDDLSRAGAFVSAFVAIYDPATRRLVWANAGHNRPLLVQVPGRGPRILRHLDADGLLIGVLDQVSFEQPSLDIDSPSTLVLYTDGVVEAPSRNDGADYGTDRLAALVMDEAHRPARELCDLIFDDVGEFSTTTDLADDRTLVVLIMP